MIGCTTIEQSKKLLELGLNPESADMLYTFGNLDIVRVRLTKEHWKQFIGVDIIPSWSISAILEILPTRIVHSIVGMNKYLEMDIDILGEERVFSLSFGKDVSEGFYCDYDVTYCDDYGCDGKAYAIITYDKDNPIIPFYNALVWLLENKKIKEAEVEWITE